MNSEKPFYIGNIGVSLVSATCAFLLSCILVNLGVRSEKALLVVHSIALTLLLVNCSLQLYSIFAIKGWLKIVPTILLVIGVVAVCGFAFIIGFMGWRL